MVFELLAAYLPVFLQCSKHQDNDQNINTSVRCTMNIKCKYIFARHSRRKGEYTYQQHYWVTQKLPQIYTANHATFQIQIRKITAQICGNIWVTQYIAFYIFFEPLRVGCWCLDPETAISTAKTGGLQLLKCLNLFAGYLR